MLHCHTYQCCCAWLHADRVLLPSAGCQAPLQRTCNRHLCASCLDNCNIPASTATAAACCTAPQTLTSLCVAVWALCCLAGLGLCCQPRHWHLVVTTLAHTAGPVGTHAVVRPQRAVTVDVHLCMHDSQDRTPATTRVSRGTMLGWRVSCSSSPSLPAAVCCLIGSTHGHATSMRPSCDRSSCPRLLLG